MMVWIFSVKRRKCFLTPEYTGKHICHVWKLWKTWPESVYAPSQYKKKKADTVTALQLLQCEASNRW